MTIDNKPILKIDFVDVFDGVSDFFIDWLGYDYQVEITKQNPNYLIFCDETFGTNNLSYDMNKTVKIFYTGENRFPSQYACHYGISFSHHSSENLYRLPLYVLDNWYIYNKLGVTRTLRANNIDHKKEFCGFVSSNPNQQKRNDFFKKLHAEKHIYSAGKLFNNVPEIVRGSAAAWNKQIFLHNKRFNLCFENGSTPGYCTEKLFHALLMGTVPIYWGDPCAGLDFNPKSFLSWHDYQNDDDFIEKILDVENNPKKYMEYYLEPMFSEGVSNKYMSRERFLNWFKKNVYKGCF